MLTRKTPFEILKILKLAIFVLFKDFQRGCFFHLDSDWIRCFHFLRSKSEVNRIYDFAIVVSLDKKPNVDFQCFKKLKFFTWPVYDGWILSIKDSPISSHLISADVGFR